MKISLFFIVSLKLFLSLSTACQMGPSFADTKEFNHHDARFYLHTDVSQRKKERRRQILLDNKRTTDYSDLDKSGFKLTPGEHTVRIVDDKDEVKQDFKYKAEPGKEYHMIYCESDDSVHWYAFDPDKKPDLSQRAKDVCRPIKEKEKK